MTANDAPPSPSSGPSTGLGSAPPPSDPMRGGVLDDVVRRIPKAEIHVHLEGCFDLADLIELAKANHVPLPRTAAQLFDVAAIDDPTFGVGNFLELLDWECGLVQTPEQAARTAYRFAARESASGVRYADCIVNPTHWGAWTHRVPALFDALAAGLDEAEQDGLCPALLCVSLLRQQSATEAAEIVDWMIEARPNRVVALSIDGNEQTAGRTSPRFADAFQRAGAAGFRRTVHAGESSGPEGVWDALDLLGAERIDHGVRAIEDPELVKVLVDRQMPLNICPRSNLVARMYADRASHPLETFRQAGLPVSVNTDDPAALGFRLESEWVACATTFGWDFSVLVDIARTSIEASFADDDLKKQLLGELAAA